MELNYFQQNVPIRLSQEGVPVIGDTPVTLETIVSAFHRGATPEEIVMQFPTLRLADVYTVIGYYLQHQDEVNAFLGEEYTPPAGVRRQVENLADLGGIRERLLSRQRHA